jgi:hypothetical protein
MRLIDLRLRCWVRRAIYVIVAGAWCTGLSFYVLRGWFQIEGEFGSESHAWQAPMLLLHGAIAFAALLMIGAMLFSHVPTAWRTMRSRWHGLTLAASLCVMLLTAWCLYYLGNDAARTWAANVHLVVGLSLPAQVAWHVVLGRRNHRQLMRERRMPDAVTAVATSTPVRRQSAHSARAQT